MQVLTPQVHLGLQRHSCVHSRPRRELTTDYDAMTLSPMEVAPPSFHTTVFPVSDKAVMEAAAKMIEKLKAKKYYTDTANFDLRCGICGIGLKGEKGAREHAMVTGREWELLCRCTLF